MTDEANKQEVVVVNARGHVVVTPERYKQLGDLEKALNVPLSKERVLELAAQLREELNTCGPWELSERSTVYLEKVVTRLFGPLIHKLKTMSQELLRVTEERTSYLEHRERLLGDVRVHEKKVEELEAKLAVAQGNSELFQKHYEDMCGAAAASDNELAYVRTELLSITAEEIQAFQGGTSQFFGERLSFFNKVMALRQRIHPDTFRELRPIPPTGVETRIGAGGNAVVLKWIMGGDEALELDLVIPATSATWKLRRNGSSLFETGGVTSPDFGDALQSIAEAHRKRMGEQYIKELLGTLPKEMNRGTDPWERKSVPSCGIPGCQCQGEKSGCAGYASDGKGGWVKVTNPQPAKPEVKAGVYTELREDLNYLITVLERFAGGSSGMPANGLYEALQRFAEKRKAKE